MGCFIERKFQKEFPTGGDVEVSIKYNIADPQEMKSAPKYVKQIMSNDENIQLLLSKAK